MMINHYVKSTPVLVIAAHPDDEVLGCGGTLAMLSARGVPVDVIFLADGENARRDATKEKINKRRVAAKNAGKILSLRSTHFLDFPDNSLDSVPRLEIIQAVEARIEELKTRHIFSHTRWDINIDHQIAHEVAITVARPSGNGESKILSLNFFEVLSSSEWRPHLYGGQFNPTCFVDIEKWLEVKLLALQCYEEELRAPPHPRSEIIVRAQGALRGSQSGLRVAEAFEIGRVIIPN